MWPFNKQCPEDLYAISTLADSSARGLGLGFSVRIIETEVLSM